MTRRAALIVLGVAIATGAAAAAPVGVLELSDGSQTVTVPFEDGDALTYSYVQSVYGAVVLEEHERADGFLRMRRVRSTDIKAVEYFRWDGPIGQDERGYVQDAPPYEVAEFVIRITPASEQTLRTSRWTLDLPARFGPVAVKVRPGWLPRALAARLPR